MTQFHYTLYGLRLRSEIELPELVEAECDEIDVDIRLVSEVPDGGTLVSIDDVARYCVRGGDTILVWPAEGASMANLRLFLLGTVMGILLHQRGDLPLHANSLLIRSAAIMVMGASGSGKSSLAAWMGRHGVVPLSDDVCVARFDSDGVAHLYPGVPRLRLWEDALIREGRQPEGLNLVYEGDPDYLKFNLPIPHDGQRSHGSPLKAAYILEIGEEFNIEQIQDVEAVAAYFAHTYRGEYVQTDGAPAAHWASCVKLAAHVPTFRIARPMQLPSIDEHNALILEHMRALISASDED